MAEKLGAALELDAAALAAAPVLGYRLVEVPGRGRLRLRQPWIETENDPVTIDVALFALCRPLDGFLAEVEVTVRREGMVISAQEPLMTTLRLLTADFSEEARRTYVYAQPRLLKSALSRLPDDVRSRYVPDAEGFLEQAFREAHELVIQKQQRLKEHAPKLRLKPSPTAIEQLLRSRGAADMPHPGGTLLEHLLRVSRRLAEWGVPGRVEIAGLCHAFYGTDGFAPTLLDVAAPADRAILADLIGEETEALVYLYASCDRGVTYPRLRLCLSGADSDADPDSDADSDQAVFRDRFTGTDHTPATADLGAFLDITAANELDVFAHNPDLATRYGPGIYRLLEPEPVRALLSAAAWEAVQHSLKPE